MELAISFLLFFLLFSTTTLAQSDEPSTKGGAISGGSALKIIGNVKNSFPGLSFGQTACDEDGNVYARTLDKSKDSLQAFLYAPVRKVGPGGALAQSFAAPPGLSVNGFSVRKNGEVYLTAWSEEPEHRGSRAYVVEFTPNGSMIATVQVTVEEEFLPAHIAAFPDGNFLLAGRQGDRSHTPYMGVFSSDGKLIKKVTQPEDDELRKRADAGDADVVDSYGVGNDAVDLGGATTGSDGNAYVLRRTSPALIFAVSPRGEVLRTLHISSDDALAFPEEFLAFRDGLVIVFAHRGGGLLLKVVDLYGNSIATYELDKLRLGSLACYAPPTFTFMTSSNDENWPMMYFTRVQAK